MTGPRQRLRVCVISSGHLSTCPRMVRAADAFAEAGHIVRVVAAQHLEWATAADRDLLARRRWEDVEFVRFAEADAVQRMRSGIRQRASRAAVAVGGAAAAPDMLLARATGRMHPELVDAALRQPCDVLYGGTSGALMAVAEAARRLGRPYGLDLEDAHSLEPLEEGDESAAARMLAVERAVLPDASFVTAAGEAVAAYYRRTHGLAPLVVNNVFELPRREQPIDPHVGPLRLYWFSQTIGPRRGLEEAVSAIRDAKIPAVLHLRGRADAAFVADLRRLAERSVAPLILEVSPPGAPDDMVALAEGHHVGLALERIDIPHRAVCSPNKVFAYLAAGLAIAASDSQGLRPVLDTLSDAALRVVPGDLSVLVAGLRRWHEDRQMLWEARRQAWNAAQVRWHWGHPLEAGALTAALERAAA